MTRTQELRQAALLIIVLWSVDVALFIAPGAIGGALPDKVALARILLIGVGGMLLTAPIYVLARMVDARAVWLRYGAIVVGAVLCGGLLAGFDLSVQERLRQALAPGARALTGQEMLIHGLTNWIGLSWIFGLLGAIFLMVRSNQRLRQQERELAQANAAALQAQNAATAARLAALRYQLNPHFLFNTLNAVSSAVVTARNDEAEAMLARLAEFLRLTLTTDPEAMVPLEDEFATLQTYLEIESERFRERLAVRFTCPDRLRSALAPTFLLQPLVENAIKHGVSSTSRTVTLSVEASQDGEDLVLFVEDDGGPAAPAHEDGSPGLGLANVRQRLTALYGPRGVLQAASRETGFLAMVRLPLARRDAALAA
jgi:hypothetical protein